ncbi:hypothetical protein [Terrabacter sp. 2RAF25]|uniref:hypothetical protein n=1 Tax=Terrabacter sp. 2RAF25 TaxID=3232998 RepID=UPI003F9E0E4C
MPTDPSPDPSRRVPPDWALARAMSDRDENDADDLEQRAWQFVQDFEDERHDEEDDPDQGGES